MDINLVEYVINGANLVKMVKIGPFWHICGAKMTSYVTIWESCQIIFSLNVSENYYSHVYGHKSGQKCR